MRIAWGIRKDTGKAMPLGCDGQGNLLVTPSNNAVVSQDRAVGAAAALANNVSNVLDLGVSSPLTMLAAVKSGVSSPTESLVIECSADGATNWIATAAPQTGVAANVTSATVMGVTGRVTARYARINYTNGTTAQTALVLRLAAMQ